MVSATLVEKGCYPLVKKIRLMSSVHECYMEYDKLDFVPQEPQAKS